MAASATPDQDTAKAAAEAKRQAQKTLADTIREARKTYSTAVGDAKVARDTTVAHAYQVFQETIAVSWPQPRVPRSRHPEWVEATGSYRRASADHRLDLARLRERLLKVFSAATRETPTPAMALADGSAR